MTRAFIAVGLVCSAAVSAHAEDFRVRGTVDMGGSGGNGDALFGDFAEAGDPDNPVVPSPFGPTFNGDSRLSVVGTMTPTSFTGLYFPSGGGVDSVMTPGGRDGVEIFRGGFGADYALAGVIRVLIRDVDGLDVNIEFAGMNTDAIVVGAIGGDGVLDQRYQLRQYDDGFRSLWIEAIPAPGVVALIGPMGLMAGRRRRS